MSVYSLSLLHYFQINLDLPDIFDEIACKMNGCINSYFVDGSRGKVVLQTDEFDAAKEQINSFLGTI